MKDRQAEMASFRGECNGRESKARRELEAAPRVRVCLGMAGLASLMRRWVIDLIHVKDGESTVHILSTQAEEDCLQVVDELMAKRQQLQDTFRAQNANAEKVQAQIEEERKKLLAVDR